MKTDWKDKDGNEYKNVTEDVEWADTEKHLRTVIKRLKPHYGERVVVFGGVGPGVSLATLTSARVTRSLLLAHPDKCSLSVYLKDETQPFGDKNGKRNPWIGSWQIAVKV